jgi:predicted Zn-dependent protease
VRRPKTALLAGLLVGALVATSACTTPPAGGGPILAMGSVEDDVQVGREAHPQILRQYGGSVGDEAVERYVQNLGTRLKNVSELSELDFTFTVLDSEIVNAFALPGGYVYVTRGLMALAENEAELAGVIGHEIGHVTARHGAARQTTGTLATALGQIGGALLGAYVGGEAGARLGGQLGQQAGYGLTMTYSRSQEYEADELGVRYLSRADYDPVAMATFLEALQSNAELQARLAGMNGGNERSLLDSFFASHPNAPDRVARARREARDKPGSQLDRDALLDRIDGLVYGQSPEQGFVMGQRFAHPGLRVAFSYPTGYRIINQPDKVIGRGDNRFILFDLATDQQASSPAQHLQRSWLEGTDVRDVQAFTTAGGLDAAIGYAQVQLSGRPTPGGFVAIQGPDRQFYRFAILAGQIGQTERSQLRETADSLRRLSTAEAAELKPMRIRLVTVQQGDTIDSLARRMEVDNLPREQFVTLNGLDRGRELRPGERVKIIVRG